MAGKREKSPTTKSTKTPESEAVSNSAIVVSDSEESDSFELSLISQMHKLPNSSKIQRPNNPIKPDPEEDLVVADSEEGEDEGNQESEVKIEETNGHNKISQNGNGKMSGNKKGKEIEKSESALYKLPMRRITRIIKSENADMRITHEATFLINKATEKFLELFAKEAYACAFLDRKNQVAYSHLSKVVAKRRRFGFLSDFVPEQVKAEDALAELSMNEK